jgi:hypothetical protein
MKEFLELPQLIDINHTLIIKNFLKPGRYFLGGSNDCTVEQSCKCPADHEMDGGQS